MKFNLLKGKKVWPIIFFLIFVLFFLDIFYFFFTPILSHRDTPVVYSLWPGTSYWKSANQLHSRGLLSRPSYWLALGFLEGNLKNLKAGDYQISPGVTTPHQLLSQMLVGKGVLYSVTIPEGWTFAQMKEAISKNPYLKHMENASTDILSRLNLIIKFKYPEGYFFPETYYFVRWTPEEKVYEKAYQTMEEKINTAWLARAPDLPYNNQEEVLIVASLIEKETAQHDERPLVAGVILNRLKKRMYLQIDACVIYGLQDNYRGKLTKGDLKIETAYNLYLHKGLPPTPICLPSFDSIHAALHPIQTESLFYVSRGDGTHQFSKTLKEHQTAINKYLRHKT